MRRISGGAVWSNRPCTDLARASVEQSAGATLLMKYLYKLIELT